MIRVAVTIYCDSFKTTLSPDSGKTIKLKVFGFDCRDCDLFNLVEEIGAERLLGVIGPDDAKVYFDSIELEEDDFF